MGGLEIPLGKKIWWRCGGGTCWTWLVCSRWWLTELLPSLPGDIRVFLLPGRLWSPSRACDSTPGNCTLLLDDALTVASVFPCMVPSSTLPVAPPPDCFGAGPPTRLSWSSSCCWVGVRPSILARSSRRLLLSTMLTLQHSNPEREERTEKKKTIRQNTNLTTPLRPLSSAPVLFSSCRASPVSYLFLAICCTDDPLLHTALQLLVGI